MYNKTTLLTAATSLVGFRADASDTYAGLSAALKASTSGLYVNDLTAVDFEMLDAVLSNNQTDAKTYLANVLSSETISILERFVNRVKTNLNSRELLNNQSIVTGVASFNDRVTQNARFVGYWLRPHSSENLSVQITKLGFQSTVIQSNVKIYLYVTSQIEPLATYTFDITTANSLVWQSITSAILRYEGDSIGTGQNYLLGYYEQDPNNVQAQQLQGQALTMSFDCGGCSNAVSKIYNKYLGIYPVEINNAYLNWNAAQSRYDIPLVDNVGDFVTSQTYGLIAKINATCDITSVLVTNIQMFARALQHAVATRILYDAYAANRINSISDSKREQFKQFALKYDGILNGYTPPEGKPIKGIIDTLTIDFSSLDHYCLPCKPGIITGRLVR